MGRYYSTIDNYTLGTLVKMQFLKMDSCLPSRIRMFFCKGTGLLRRVVVGASRDHSSWQSVAQEGAKTRTPIVHLRSSLDSGCIDYARGWAWQAFLLNRRLVRRQQSSREMEVDHDTVLLFEHKPVYTLGRGANENNLTFLKEVGHDESRERLSRRSRGKGSARLTLDRGFLEPDLLQRLDCEAVDVLCNVASPVLAPNGAPIFRVERGGEVTFHGPGQLVAYPLFDLQRDPFQVDLHWFLAMIEQVIIETLEHYEIESARDEINTGVWVGLDKVAAVGVTASRWITTHGFALNVCPDLSYFDTSTILPCGIHGRNVTSIAEILIRRGDLAVPSVLEVSRIVVQKINRVFQIEIEEAQSIR
jgi:lipoyl(octanoyl) transferase